MKLIVIAIILAVSSHSMATEIDEDWEGFKRVVEKFDRMGIQNEASRSEETRALNFPCDPNDVPSGPYPTSVHQLTPKDIRVIGAIGDSLTAANGAKAKLLTSVLTEYRGVSWCIGGDEDYRTVTTLPNLLRRYNPYLKGFSLGTGDYTSSGAGFNAARPGHTSNEMLEQAKYLTNKTKNDKNVDFSNDWKLITFFVGGNDLCKQCKNPPLYTPSRFVDNIRQTLDFFQKNLPRALINLVLTLDVRGIEPLSNTFVCKTMHTQLCDCAISQSNATVLEYLVDNYQKLTKELIESGRYDNDDQFTVVVQPFMEKMTPPTKPDGNPDSTYFAPDCFHFSQKGHETSALELWNNMFQRVGKKDNVWQAIVGKIECPSKNAPYIYTNRNS